VIGLKEVYYEDVKVGDELPALKKTITKEQILNYADACGDYNPIHVDEESAKKAGLGGIIAHGLLGFASVIQLITDWLRDPMDLKKIVVRFTSMVRPGDVLSIKGTIKDKYVKDSLNYVDCEVVSKNQRGEKTIIGKATAILPSKTD